MSKEPINVLYLGMATDIMAPLLLVPDLDNLYVLNSLDDAYGTWEEHKNIIRKVLIWGNDIRVVDSRYFFEEVRKLKPRGKEWKDVHKLAGPSEIISDVDEPKRKCLTGAGRTTDKWCYTNSVWKLSFMYNGKIRNLIYYYNFRFTHYEWPKEIQNIKYHIWNGAYSWSDMTEYPDEKMVLNMLPKRSAPESYVFALSFKHEKFPEHIYLYDGHERWGQSIGKIKLDFSDLDWWKKNYRVQKKETKKRSKTIKKSKTKKSKTRKAAK